MGSTLLSRVIFSLRLLGLQERRSLRAIKVLEQVLIKAWGPARCRCFPEDCLGLLQSDLRRAL